MSGRIIIRQIGRVRFQVSLIVGEHTAQWYVASLADAETLANDIQSAEIRHLAK